MNAIEPGDVAPCPVGDLWLQRTTDEKHFISSPLDVEYVSAVYRGVEAEERIMFFARRKTGPSDLFVKLPRFRLVASSAMRPSTIPAVVLPDELQEEESVRCAYEFDSNAEHMDQFLRDNSNVVLPTESETRGLLVHVSLVAWCHKQTNVTSSAHQVIISVGSFLLHEEGVQVLQLVISREHKFSRNLFGRSGDEVAFISEPTRGALERLMLHTMYRLREDIWSSVCTRSSLWVMARNETEIKKYESLRFLMMHVDLPSFARTPSSGAWMMIRDLFSAMLLPLPASEMNEDSAVTLFEAQVCFFQCSAGSLCQARKKALSGRALCIYCARFMHEECGEVGTMTDFNMLRCLGSKFPDALSAEFLIRTIKPQHMVCHMCVQIRMVGPHGCLMNHQLLIGQPAGCKCGEATVHSRHVCYKCRCLVHPGCVMGYVAASEEEVARHRWRKLPLCLVCSDASGRTRRSLEFDYFQSEKQQRMVESRLVKHCAKDVTKKKANQDWVEDLVHMSMTWYSIDCTICDACTGTVYFHPELLCHRGAYDGLRNVNYCWTTPTIMTYITLLRHHLHTVCQDQRVLSFYFETTHIIEPVGEGSFLKEKLPERITQVILVMNRVGWRDVEGEFVDPGHWTLAVLDLADQTIRIYDAPQMMNKSMRILMQTFVSHFLLSKDLVDADVISDIVFVEVLDGELDSVVPSPNQQGRNRWFWVEIVHGLQHKLKSGAIGQIGVDCGPIICLLVRELFCKGFNPLSVPHTKWRTFLSYELMQWQMDYGSSFQVMRGTEKHKVQETMDILAEKLTELNIWFKPTRKRLETKPLKPIKNSADGDNGFSISRPCSPLNLNDEEVVHGGKKISRPGSTLSVLPQSSVVIESNDVQEQKEGEESCVTETVMETRHMGDGHSSTTEEVSNVSRLASSLSTPVNLATQNSQSEKIQEVAVSQVDTPVLQQGQLPGEVDALVPDPLEVDTPVLQQGQSASEVDAMVPDPLEVDTPVLQQGLSAGEVDAMVPEPLEVDTHVLQQGLSAGEVDAMVPDPLEVDTPVLQQGQSAGEVDSMVPDPSDLSEKEHVSVSGTEGSGDMRKEVSVRLTTEVALESPLESPIRGSAEGDTSQKMATRVEPIPDEMEADNVDLEEKVVENDKEVGDDSDSENNANANDDDDDDHDHDDGTSNEGADKEEVEDEINENEPENADALEKDDRNSETDKQDNSGGDKGVSLSSSGSSDGEAAGTSPNVNVVPTSQKEKDKGGPAKSSVPTSSSSTGISSKEALDQEVDSKNTKDSSKEKDSKDDGYCSVSVSTDSNSPSDSSFDEELLGKKSSSLSSKSDEDESKKKAAAAGGKISKVQRLEKVVDEVEICLQQPEGGPFELITFGSSEKPLTQDDPQQTVPRGLGSSVRKSLVLESSESGISSSKNKDGVMHGTKKGKLHEEIARLKDIILQKNQGNNSPQGHGVAGKSLQQHVEKVGGEVELFAQEQPEGSPLESSETPLTQTNPTDAPPPAVRGAQASAKKVLVMESSDSGTSLGQKKKSVKPGTKRGRLHDKIGQQLKNVVQEGNMSSQDVHDGFHVHSLQELMSIGEATPMSDDGSDVITTFDKDRSGQLDKTKTAPTVGGKKMLSVTMEEQENDSEEDSSSLENQSSGASSMVERQSRRGRDKSIYQRAQDYRDRMIFDNNKRRVFPKIRRRREKKTAQEERPVSRDSDGDVSDGVQTSAHTQRIAALYANPKKLFESPEHANLFLNKVRLEDGEPMNLAETRRAMDRMFLNDVTVPTYDKDSYRSLRSKVRGKDKRTRFGLYEVELRWQAFDQLESLQYVPKEHGRGPCWVGVVKGDIVSHKVSFSFIRDNFDERFWKSVKSHPERPWNVPIGSSRDGVPLGDDGEAVHASVASLMKEDFNLRPVCPLVWRMQKQGEESCLLASFASGLRYLGQCEAANNVCSYIPKSLHNKDGWELMLRIGNKFVQGLAKIEKFKDECLDILVNVSLDITVIQLCSNDGNIQHAITTVGGWIFDSNRPKALPLSKESLDWCCAVGGGFHHVFQGARFVIGKKQVGGRKRKRKHSQKKTLNGDDAEP